MSRNLDDLQSDFRAAVDLVLADCLSLGVEMRPFHTVRSPHHQARLWRQSRTWAQIQAAIETMRSQGAPWLASVLLDVGPQSGRHATGALPGRSWHQWGLAVDCFLVGPQGEALWDSLEPGYDVYAQAAIKRGLHLGPSWDRVHIQGPAGSVTRTWPEVDKAMRQRWDV
jgi:hypothetical protein